MLAVTGISENFLKIQSGYLARPSKAGNAEKVDLAGNCGGTHLSHLSSHARDYYKARTDALLGDAAIGIRIEDLSPSGNTGTPTPTVCNYWLV